jgi:hypothetical protein
VSDDFLSPLFQSYFKKLNLPNLMDKKQFYELADFVPESQLDPGVGEKLDSIVQVWRQTTGKERSTTCLFMCRRDGSAQRAIDSTSNA